MGVVMICQSGQDGPISGVQGGTKNWTVAWLFPASILWRIHRGFVPIGGQILTMSVFAV